MPLPSGRAAAEGDRAQPGAGPGSPICGALILGGGLIRLAGRSDCGAWDAVFVIADGLSPVGVQLHAVPLLRACLDRLPGWTIAPVVIATQARVALGR